MKAIPDRAILLAYRMWRKMGKPAMMAWRMAHRKGPSIPGLGIVGYYNGGDVANIPYALTSSPKFHDELFFMVKPR